MPLSYLKNLCLKSSIAMSDIPKIFFLKQKHPSYRVFLFLVRLLRVLVSRIFSSFTHSGKQDNEERDF